MKIEEGSYKYLGVEKVREQKMRETFYKEYLFKKSWPRFTVQAK